MYRSVNFLFGVYRIVATALKISVIRDELFVSNRILLVKCISPSDWPQFYEMSSKVYFALCDMSCLSFQINSLPRIPMNIVGGSLRLKIGRCCKELLGHNRMRAQTVWQIPT